MSQLPKAVSSFLSPLLITTRFPVLSKPTKLRSLMSYWKTHQNRVETVPLPNELWLIIFDIVIEEGIIRLDQCDYTTFPYMGSSLSSSARRHQFCDSYWRLRLVCRRFNGLLGAQPWQSFSDPSSLPFPITTRALYLDLKALPRIDFPRLSAETSTFGRLVSLDVECDISPCHFLLASAGLAFPNIQRLALRFVHRPYSPPESSFWTILHYAFPFLVTLALVPGFRDPAEHLQLAEGDEVVCFEWLEILYFSQKVTYLGCRFPRLRHASIWECSVPELEILTGSPDLESLLIQSYLQDLSIDVTSCLRLKLLGFPDCSFIGVVPIDLDHPVEHIWIYSAPHSGNPELFDQLSRRLPKISRITVDIISSSPAYHSRQINKFRRMRLDSFGLTMRPLTMRRSGFPILVIERVDTIVKEGTLSKVWRKMRR